MLPWWRSEGHLLTASACLSTIHFVCLISVCETHKPIYLWEYATETRCRLRLQMCLRDSASCPQVIPTAPVIHESQDKPQKSGCHGLRCLVHHGSVGISFVTPHCWILLQLAYSHFPTLCNTQRKLAIVLPASRFTHFTSSYIIAVNMKKQFMTRSLSVDPGCGLQLHSCHHFPIFSNKDESLYFQREEKPNPLASQVL